MLSSFPRGEFLHKTTVGWDFEAEWNDGSSNWLPLKLLKESNLLEAAEFVQAKDIAYEPAFAW